MDQRSSKRQRREEQRDNRDPFYRPLDGEARPYLESEVSFGSDGRLVDGHGFAVMMQWEQKLMEQHAAWICGAKGGKRYLNVGFGMGLVDTAIEKHRKTTTTRHVICEAHPSVFERAKKFADGVNTAQGRSDAVVVLRGKWQDVWQDVAAMGPFDGVFWDTYEETVEDFIPLLPALMPHGGRFSFCNVYQPQCVVRHIAYSAYLAAVLARGGIETAFDVVPVSIPEGEYDGVEAPYWLHESYLVPRCTVPPSHLVATAAERHDPEKRRRLGLESGEPLDKLLWNAKFWAVSKAAAAVGWSPPEALLPLAQVWEGVRGALGQEPAPDFTAPRG